MSPTLILLAVLVALVLATVGWLALTVRGIVSPPAIRPATYRPSGRPVVVCAGDSITHGTVSADWVSDLRARLAGRADVVNAGINGELAWNLDQRVEGILAIEPAVVVVLIGSNDTMGVLDDAWAQHYITDHGLPQEPSLDFYTDNLQRLLSRLDTRATVAVCTLPPLGEQDDSRIAGFVAERNAVVERVASKLGIEILRLHERIRERFPARPEAPRFEEDRARARKLMEMSAAQHSLLRRSWDAIAARRGLTVTHDHL
ncbi:MAG: SGNH/GDSL hydrolase family protein, partial [Deltaproteobacteria bacterium]|nr:SGNH/GDSL hydrolase family protein [Deltaproteobacteria bacterium]